MEPSPYEGKSGRKPSAETQASYFKMRLLECIAGLDRGFAANGYAAMQVESAALALTEQSEPISLTWTPGADISLIAHGFLLHSAIHLRLFCFTESPAQAAPQGAGSVSLLCITSRRRPASVSARCRPLHVGAAQVNACHNLAVVHECESLTVRTASLLARHCPWLQEVPQTHIYIGICRDHNPYRMNGWTHVDASCWQPS